MWSHYLISNTYYTTDLSYGTYDQQMKYFMRTDLGILLSVVKPQQEMRNGEYLCNKDRNVAIKLNQQKHGSCTE